MRSPSVPRLAAVTLALLLGAALAPLVPGAAAQPAPASSSAGPGGGPPPDECGPRLKKSQGGGFWDCTFADHFDGGELDREKWSPMLTARTGANTQDCRVDTPENISVSDGTLKLTVRDEGEPFVCESWNGDYETQITGGGVTSYGIFSQTYGRIEYRAKFPDVDVPGLHSALWTWPQERRYGADSGEIDVAEWRSLLPDRVTPFVHYNDDGTDKNKTNWHCYVEDTHKFHNYAVEWTEETLTFLYDGEVCLVNDWSPAEPLVKPQPFDEPIFLNLNQQLGGGHNQYDPDVTPLPATMEVDHVRVWR